MKNLFSDYSNIRDIYYIYYAHNQLIYTLDSKSDKPINITIYIHPVHPRYEYTYQTIKRYFKSLDQHFIWWNNVAGIYKITYHDIYTEYIKKPPVKIHHYLLMSMTISNLDDSVIAERIYNCIKRRYFFENLPYEIYKYTLKKTLVYKNYNFELETRIILSYLF